jgi:hypothetical protein
MVSAAHSTGWVTVLSLVGMSHSFVPPLLHRSHALDGRRYMVAESPPLFGTLLWVLLRILVANMHPTVRHRDVIWLGLVHYM